MKDGKCLTRNVIYVNVLTQMVKVGVKNISRQGAVDLILHFVGIAIKIDVMNVIK